MSRPISLLLLFFGISVRDWAFMFEVTTASNILWGETLRKGERNHLDFDKSRGNARQRVSSEDTNTGIMPGSR